ncbi:hypothetical protein J2Z60_002067 [Lactobacillus colini]|uniref:Uridine kinase n=1 Tax=Lactobacillus colini TaxID=1819254 RepID=A0ABS4MHQ8_9LACO|nr:hypothetical protein [Lactobacillus colini]
MSNRLQKHFGYQNCLVLHQDVIRRDILHAGDRIGTLAVGLIEIMVEYGLKNYPIVILEGILRKDVYGQMLHKLVFENKSLVYYLDIPFEKTLQRDQLKKSPFGSKKLESWWRKQDYLDKDDIILNDEQADNWYEQILDDIKNS